MKQKGILLALCLLTACATVLGQSEHVLAVSAAQKKALAGGALYANTEESCAPTVAAPSGSVTQAGPLGAGELTTKTGPGSRIQITGRSLSWDEMAQVVYNAGFRGQDLINFTAVSERESGRGATRYLYNASTKDNSYGPWMMNIWVGTDKGGAAEMLGYVTAGGGTKLEDMYDPQIAANAAFHMFQRYGDKPWFGYRPGITVADLKPEWVAAATAAIAKITGVTTATPTPGGAPAEAPVPTCSGSGSGNSQISGSGVDKQVGGVQYYSQCDAAWKTFTYGIGGDTVCSSGCGPTSVAMVISTMLKDKSIIPPVVAKYGQENGTVIINSSGESEGSYLSIITKSAANWGLKSKSVGASKDAIKAVFDAGGYVVDNVGPGDFTSGGHYIVLRGFDTNGKLLVSDPNDRQPSDPNYLKKTQTAWDFTQVMSQSKAMIAILPATAVLP